MFGTTVFEKEEGENEILVPNSTIKKTAKTTNLHVGSDFLWQKANFDNSAKILWKNTMNMTTPLSGIKLEFTRGLCYFFGFLDIKIRLLHINHCLNLLWRYKQNIILLLPYPCYYLARNLLPSSQQGHCLFQQSGDFFQTLSLKFNIHFHFTGTTHYIDVQ